MCLGHLVLEGIVPTPAFSSFVKRFSHGGGNQSPPSPCRVSYDCTSPSCVVCRGQRRRWRQRQGNLRAALQYRMVLGTCGWFTLSNLHKASLPRRESRGTRGDTAPLSPGRRAHSVHVTTLIIKQNLTNTAGESLSEASIIAQAVEQVYWF